MMTALNLVPYLQKKLEIFINRENSMTPGSTMAKSSLKIKNGLDKMINNMAELDTFK